MARALKVCPCTGCPAHDGSCPELVTSGRCTGCARTADRARGTRQQRGYGAAHVNRFRRGVLRKNPLCVCTDQGHGHGPRCLAPSTVADHWPLSRRELVDAGLDPNDPAHGRGLCKPCHDRHTATAQPGGWNNR